MTADSAALAESGPEQSLDATRERILAVALELIAEQGFAATSTREISERLGFSKAALYYHFRTKNELLLALLKPSIDQFAEIVEAAELDISPERRATVLGRYVDLVAANEELMRVLSQDPATRRPPASTEATALYQRLTVLLTGQDAPDSAARAQVRAALAGIHAVFVYAPPEDDRTVLHAIALAAALRAMDLS